MISKISFFFRRQELHISLTHTHIDRYLPKLPDFAKWVCQYQQRAHAILTRCGLPVQTWFIQQGLSPVLESASNTQLSIYIQHVLKGPPFLLCGHYQSHKRRTCFSDIIVSLYDRKNLTIEVIVNLTVMGHHSETIVNWYRKGSTSPETSGNPYIGKKLYVLYRLAICNTSTTKHQKLIVLKHTVTNYIQNKVTGTYIQRRVQPDQCYFTVQIIGINFECSLQCNSTVILCIALLLHII